HEPERQCNSEEDARLPMFRSNGLSPQRPSLSYQFRLCVEKKTGFRPPSASRWMLRLISALPTTSMTGRVQLFKGSAALCAVQRLNTTLALSALVEPWQWKLTGRRYSGRGESRSSLRT